MANINTNRIPKEMKDFPAWLNWRKEPRLDNKGNLKPTKIPYDPKNGKFAKSTEPSTHSTFEDAVNKANICGYDGIGFVITDSPLVCIDLDHCFQDGKLTDFAVETLKTFKSYTEVSPSGNGVHIFFVAEFDNEKYYNRKKIDEKYDVEIYSTGRYLTITGNTDGLPQEFIYDNILDMQNELNDFSEKYLKRDIKQRKEKANKEKTEKIEPETIELSQEQNNLLEHILYIINNSKQSEKFNRLYNGDIVGYSSNSEADLAICSILAFYVQDYNIIYNILMKSKLVREKWYNHPTYLYTTISYALDNVTETYDPNHRIKEFINDLNNKEKKETTKKDIEKDVEEEVEEKLEFSLKDLPEGTFKDLCRFFKVSTICNDYYAFAAAISFFATIQNNRCRLSIDNNLKIKTEPLNTYEILIGPSCVGRKSSLVSNIHNLAQIVSSNNCDISTDFTPEGILSNLERNKNRAITLVKDEFRSIAGVEKKYNESLITDLTTLYNGDLIVKNRSGKTPQIVNDFSLNLISCTTKKWLWEVLGNTTSSLFVGGFFPRFNFSILEEDEEEANLDVDDKTIKAKYIEDKNLKIDYNKLLEDLTRIYNNINYDSNKVFFVDINKESLDIINEFKNYYKQKKGKDFEDSSEESFLRRIMIKIKKTACFLSISNGNISRENHVDDELIKISIKYHIANMYRLLEHFQTESIVGIESSAIKLLEKFKRNKDKNIITKREIMRSMHRQDVDKRMQIVQLLIDNGNLEEIDKGWNNKLSTAYRILNFDFSENKYYSIKEFKEKFYTFFKNKKDVIEEKPILTESINIAEEEEQQKEEEINPIDDLCDFLVDKNPKKEDAEKFVENIINTVADKVKNKMPDFLRSISQESPRL